MSVSFSFGFLVVVRSVFERSKMIVMSGPVSLEIGSDQAKPPSERSGSIHSSIVKVRMIYGKRNERDSVYGWITSAFWMLLAVAMLVIGSIYMHKCCGYQLIPVYLVVSGAVGLVEVIRQVFRRLGVISAERDYLGCALQVVLFVWLIVGSVWVYGANGHVIHDSADTTCHYCHRVPFVFALVQITTVWCLMSLWMIVQCAACGHCRGWQIF